MLTYPEGLPLPLREGYGFEPVSPILRSQKMSGRAVQRRLYSSVPTVATVSWMFTDVQARLFEAWFEYVLTSGTAWFECPLKTPMGLEDYKARFTDIYSGPTLVGGSCWRFTANLELFKRPLIDRDLVIEVPDYIIDADIFDRAMNQRWPEQTE